MQTVVLPRTPEQRAELDGFIVPERAIDAQSLVAYADLVISAGGTMNREAVALGTPVWTTFEGRLGAVDERLIADGRLRRLTRAEDIALEKRADTGGERTRRDPAVLADLLLSPAGGLAAVGRLQPRMARMRRRIRSAAFPVHRHALPQVALDAGLAALAYYLAYRLRFERHPAALRHAVRSHDHVRDLRHRVLIRAARPLPALDAPIVAARVPRDRAGRGGVGVRADRLRGGRPAVLVTTPTATSR